MVYWEMHYQKQTNMIIQAEQGPLFRKYHCSMQQALDIKVLSHIIYNPQLLYELVLENQTDITQLPDSASTQMHYKHNIYDYTEYWILLHFGTRS